MSFWRGKPGHISGFALTMLLVLLAAPFALYFLTALDTRADGQATTQVGIAEPDGQGAGAPTIGMSVGPEGFGSITQAPAKLVVMQDGGGDAGSGPAPGMNLSGPNIDADVASFLRGLPQVESGGGPKPGPDGTVICTLEGPASWRGHIELDDGCLLFRDANAPGERVLLMLPRAQVFRDAEGYLAVANERGNPERTLRVGEREGRFTGHGCSQPSYLPAPAELANQCRADRVINMAWLGRKPICSSTELARLDKARKEHEATARRIRNQREACLEKGGQAAHCPPGQIPYPIELYEPNCRAPE